MATATKDASVVVKEFLTTYFEKNSDCIKLEPALEEFSLNQNAVLAPFWKPFVRVPQRPFHSGRDEGFISKTCPDLLFFGLKDKISQPAAYEHIAYAQEQCPTFLYGTSGAGKTRTIFEYLSRHKGFYLVAGDLVRNPGSNDLCWVLRCNLNVVPLHDSFQDRCNRDKIIRWLSMLLFVRFAVHEMLEQHLDREITPYEWLLYQVFPTQLLGADLFFDALMHCENEHVEEEIPFFKWGDRGTKKVWSVFVDEAQILMELNKHQCLSKDGRKHRAALSAVVEGLLLQQPWEEVHFPVFSGTGFSLDGFYRQTNSIVGKIRGGIARPFFANFQSLSPTMVKSFLDKILDLSDANGDVVEHVCKWLCGRPRWTASFVELYSIRQEKKSYASQPWRTRGKVECKSVKLLEALDRFLNIMTRKYEGRESWSAGETSAYACFRRAQNMGLSQEILSDLKLSVCKYAVGKGHHIFSDEASKVLIRNGVAVVLDTDWKGTMIKGYLHEPIIVAAGLNSYDLDKFLRDSMANQEQGGLGEAFESLILPGLFMEKERLPKFIQNNVKEQDFSVLKSFEVSQRSSYGVVCVDARQNIKKTIERMTAIWNSTFEGQVPPFCYPDVHFGPDLMFFLRNLEDYKDFRACLLQSKYVTDVGNQQDALRTLVPDVLHCESRGKEGKQKFSGKIDQDLAEKWRDLKDQLVCDERPCLRLLVQMPAKPSSSASTGMVASGATGPIPTKKGKKRDWMIVIDDNEAGELFSAKSADLVRLLKRKKEEQVE